MSFFGTFWVLEIFKIKIQGLFRRRGNPAYQPDNTDLSLSPINISEPTEQTLVNGLNETK